MPKKKASKRKKPKKKAKKRSTPKKKWGIDKIRIGGPLYPGQIDLKKKRK